jgi:hypothetical protein
MKVRLELEFDNLNELVDNLAKLSLLGADPTSAISGTPAGKNATPTPKPAPKPKPVPVATPVPEPVATPVEPAAEPVQAATPTRVPVPVSVPALPVSAQMGNINEHPDYKNVLRPKVIDLAAKDNPALLAVMKTLGINKFQELKPEQLPDAIRLTQEALDAAVV